MIAKCIKTEKEGRRVFYGAMISESAIALVWAAAGVSFYGSTRLLDQALTGGASNVVYEISTGVLGVFSGLLAVAGVIICPITSGDTAFRSARLIVAETFRLDHTVSCGAGAAAAAVLFAVYLVLAFRRRERA